MLAHGNVVELELSECEWVVWIGFEWNPVRSGDRVHSR